MWGPQKHMREKGELVQRWYGFTQATWDGLEGVFLPDTWRSVRNGLTF